MSWAAPVWPSATPLPPRALGLHELQTSQTPADIAKSPQDLPRRRKATLQPRVVGLHELQGARGSGRHADCRKPAGHTLDGRHANNQCRCKHLNCVHTPLLVRTASNRLCRPRLSPRDHGGPAAHARGQAPPRAPGTCSRRLLNHNSMDWASGRQGHGVEIVILAGRDPMRLEHIQGPRPQHCYPRPSETLRWVSRLL